MGEQRSERRNPAVNDTTNCKHHHCWCHSSCKYSRYDEDEYQQADACTEEEEVYERIEKATVAGTVGPQF